MSETAGMPSAVGIEAVEWLSDDPSGVTVRITGRWRRRRPDWRGPAMLVIEAEGRRHRIAAMPEPPFLIGLLPGMWRMSFAVPAELVDHLEGHTWLAMGAVMAPLALHRPGRPAGSEPVSAPEPITGSEPVAGSEPVVESEPDPDASPGSEPARVRPPADLEMLAARELRSLEIGAESARRRAREADEQAARLRAQIEDLQQELAHTREEPERLHAEIAERERDLRRARQNLHAETASRREAEERLAEQERVTEHLRDRARRLSEREHELERELRRMHRAVDEAQQQAAAARAALSGVEATRTMAGDPAVEAMRTRPAEPGVEATRTVGEPAVEAMRTAVPGPGAAGTPAFPGGMLAAEFALAARPVVAAALRGPVPALPQRELVLEQSLLVAPPRLRATDTSEDERTTLQLEFEAVAAVLVREREAREAATAALAREREAREAASALLVREREAREAASALLVRERDARQAASAALAREQEAVAREREARGVAERRLLSLEQDLERQRERSRRALAAIEAFRRELHELRRTEPLRPAATEPDRPAIARPAVAPVVHQPPEPQRLEAAFEPERLNAALARLRERHPSEAQASPEPGPATEAGPAPAPDPATEPGPATELDSPPEVVPSTELAGEPTPAPPGTSSRAPHATTDAVARLFRTLVRQDPAAAGRLVLGLLPAQRLAHPRPIAYDLVLGPGACVQVTTGSERPTIVVAAAPREADAVQFRADGDPAAIARLLIAGPLRARFGRGIARVHGDRGALGAMRDLVRTPTSLGDLVDAGVTLDPALALRIIAEQIGASATEPFSIAHRPGPESPPDAVLHAAPGRPPLVTDASLELPATTTIVCPPEALLGVLIGRSYPGASVRGEGRPLVLVRRALERA